MTKAEFEKYIDELLETENQMHITYNVKKDFVSAEKSRLAIRKGRS